MIDFAEGTTSGVKIKVIGVGGGGGNAINNMIDSKLKEVGFVAANTDAQALGHNKAPLKLQLGPQLTRGLGAGADPETGKKAALEDKDRIREVIGDSQMIFVTAGMGGGTGTGAAPVIAQVSRDIGALTVGVVTRPFTFEGYKRRVQAESGVEELRGCVDSLITIPNQKLLSLTEKKTTLKDAFKLADNVLLHAVKSISDLVTQEGLINLDFADVKTIMQNQGQALMGTGFAEGEDRARNAASQAISSPLLDDVSIEGAQGVLVNITGGADLGLHEIDEAMNIIYDAAHEKANIIFGAVIDERVGESVMLTVIATGIENRQEERHPPRIGVRPRPGASHEVSPAGRERPVRPVPSERDQTRVRLVHDKTAPAAETASSQQTVKSAPKPAPAPASWKKSQEQAAAFDEGDPLDIPTFIRKLQGGAQ